jgi:cytosine/adenosine deaminase-related metal-dependent hydrolase
MSTLLVKNAALLVTMDAGRREIAGGGLFARDGFIEQVGVTEDLPSDADQVLDLKGFIVLPGLINTHHHFFQTLTRATPGAQDANLFHWLTRLYPIWAGLNPEDIFLSTQVALAELALSGCTTAADHLYIFPHGAKLDDEIAAAGEVGLRILATRGSMSVGESAGGLPPDSLVETDEAILSDSARVIERYHNPRSGSMVQIALAPCSPFSVSPQLMQKTAEMARQYGVRLHTHLAETQDEEAFCLAQFGLRPLEFMESVGWLDSNAWFAHAIHVDHAEIEKMGKAHCGVAHCPTSNMRLGSGISPVQDYRAAGVPVGLGVDGSASNDSSHLLAEARQAMLLARLKAGLQGASASLPDAPALLSAREALEMATLGGAEVLGRSDVGALSAGMCADFVAIDLNRLEYAGALADPVAAVLLCFPQRVDYNVVHGKIIVEHGELLTVDTHKLVEQQNRAAERLLSQDI